MSHEKPHADEARKSVHRNCVSADASAFDLLSIVAPSGRDQTVRLPASTTRTAMYLFLYLAARHVTFVSQLYFIVLFVFFYIHHFSFSLIRDRIEA